ncbi:hypothetical protein MMC12_005735 [Toensbergia leucococca]|nr:hypothetical protein [Toensbergia leucococca]
MPSTWSLSRPNTLSNRHHEGHSSAPSPHRNRPLSASATTENSIRIRPLPPSLSDISQPHHNRVNHCDNSITSTPSSARRTETVVPAPLSIQLRDPRQHTNESNESPILIVHGESRLNVEAIPTHPGYSMERFLSEIPSETTQAALQRAIDALGAEAMEVATGDVGCACAMERTSFWWGMDADLTCVGTFIGDAEL